MRPVNGAWADFMNYLKNRGAVFIDVYLPNGLSIDRDDIEDALALIEGLDVVGAGGGADGQNIDLELDDGAEPIEQALSAVVETLRRLGVAQGAYVRRSDTGARIPVQ